MFEGDDDKRLKAQAAATAIVKTPVSVIELGALVDFLRAFLRFEVQNQERCFAITLGDLSHALSA
jgi:hypothetical protein